jgi:hypothetical protein
MKGVKMMMPIVETHTLSPLASVTHMSSPLYAFQGRFLRDRGGPPPGSPSPCQGEGEAKAWLPVKNLLLYAPCVGEDTGGGYEIPGADHHPWPLTV